MFFEVVAWAEIEFEALGFSTEKLVGIPRAEAGACTAFSLRLGCCLSGSISV